MYSASWHDSTDLYFDIELVYVKTINDVIINNQDIKITKNGVYTADEEHTGLGEVTVSTPEINNQNITITNNGHYEPQEGYTGFSSIDVKIKEVHNQNLFVIKNGEYRPSIGFTGFDVVTVKLPDGTSSGINMEFRDIPLQIKHNFNGGGSASANCLVPNNEELDFVNQIDFSGARIPEKITAIV